MSIVTKSHTATGNGNVLSARAGEDYQYFISGTFVGTVLIEKSENGGITYETVATKTAAASDTISLTKDSLIRTRCSAYTSGTIVTTLQNAGVTVDNARIALLLGTTPAVAGLTCVAQYSSTTGMYKLDYTFQGVAVTHTDAAGSGSSGSLKLFDFVQAAVQPLASRSDLVFTGDTLIDTNAGNMAFKYGFGSVAADAGDGALTGTEVDFAAISGTITLSSFTATSASLIKGAGTAMDGTTTATDLFFNESGTAATSTANGVLTITSGTATFSGILLGDD